MLSAETVIEVGFDEYRKQFLWALSYSVERLDDVLDERPDDVDSEGFAIVADAISEAAERLSDAPGQILQVYTNKLSESLGADPTTTVLTKYAVRDLIASIVDDAHDDAFLTAVHKGRSVLPSLATHELASAGEAIRVLEGLLAAATEITKPLAMRHGWKLAQAWFEAQESGSASLPQVSVSGSDSKGPADIIEGLVAAAINLGLAQNQGPPDGSQMRLIAEYPASYCPPIGKTLAFGSVVIVEEAGGRRVALFTADGQTANGPPMSKILDLPVNVKAKMGGRIDLLGNYYVIVGGGKSAAKAFLAHLGL
jgi:hypothetical protein